MKYVARCPSYTGCSALLLAAVLLAGCGESDGLRRVSVGGQVTWDGQPVQEGSITFVPTAGTAGPMAFGEIVGGQYSIAAGQRGPVIGKHKVQIEAYRDSGTTDSGGARLKDQVIPAAYNTQTTLVVDISPSNSTQNFDLTSPH